MDDILENCKDYSPTSKVYDDKFTGLDYGILGGYFACIICFGICISLYGWWKRRRNHTEQAVGDFFLASRTMMFLPVAGSIFSSNIGAQHFIGLAGTAAANGIAVGVFEWSAMILLLARAWLFLPVYISSGITTMPEYLKERFGGNRIQMLISTLSIVLYIFINISGDLYAGSVYIKIALGWNTYVSIIALLAITALYNLTGGLKAVIYVDAVQTLIIVAGGLIVMIMGLEEVGGYDKLFNDYACAAPNITVGPLECNYPPPTFDNLVRPADDPDFPWPGAMFGVLIGSIWYFCTDQVQVQISLAAKDLSHAKLGCVIAGFLKIFPVFLMILPGMIARTLWPNEIACKTEDECLNACGQPGGCTNVAYPTLVMRILPSGLKGLLFAVMVSALMSSLSSTFNAGSSLVSMDIYRRIRPKASSSELILIGRLTILVLVGCGILWIPILESQNNSQLFDYIQSVIHFLCPPIAVLFVMAIFWERTNEAGAFWGLAVGLIMGIIRMITVFTISAPGCGEPDIRPAFISGVHYLHFSMLTSPIVAFVIIIISLLTPPIPRKYTRRLTFWTRNHPKYRVSMTEKSNGEKLQEQDDENEPNCLAKCSNSQNINESEYKVNVEGYTIQEERSWYLAGNVGAVISVLSVAFLYGFFR